MSSLEKLLEDFSVPQVSVDIPGDEFNIILKQKNRNKLFPVILFTYEWKII